MYRLAPILFLLCLSFFLSPTQAQEWTWLKGNTISDESGIYGTLTVPSLANSPGARKRAVSWTDSNDDLWLFGGFGYDVGGLIGRTNDLWRYEPLSDQWTWMGGSNARNQIGIYGSPGVPSVSNIPSTRDGATEWIDGDDRMWLFGGYGYASTNSYGMLNDLWRYEPTTGEWTWMAGSNGHDQQGTYGTKGTASVGNIPGAREYASSWVDNNGDFWLFGGLGFDKNGSYGILSDLWNYKPSTAEWTWVEGPDVVNQNGIYGTKGVPQPSNNPGGRYGHNCWIDNNGEFWLFGGIGYNGSGVFGRLNDLWKFDPVAGEWVWITGANATGQSAVYSAQGVFHPLNTPGGRQDAVQWTGNDGSLWLLGGYGHAFGANFGRLNDLWKFDPAIGLWAWFGGSTAANKAGDYGTQGIPSVNNMPGAREGSIGWSDSDGEFWLLGGYGYPINTSYGHLNDLWRYQPNSAPEYVLTPTDTFVCEGTVLVTLPFEVIDADADPLTFSGNSSNILLVQDAGLVVVPQGGQNYNLECYIEPGQTGSSTITMDVDDGNGGVDQFIFVFTVGAAPVTNVSVDICDGDSLFVAGAWQTVSGIYQDTFNTAQGCDSVIITNLNLLPSYDQTFNLSICTGDSLWAGGAFQNSNGTYYDTLNTTEGCDSLITTNLTIISIPNTILNLEICSGDSLWAGAAFQTAAGTYYDSLNSTAGCDSVIVTNLSILPTYNTTVDVEICDGDSYFAAGANQTISGTYQDTLTTLAGCDSVIITNLTVHPTFLTNNNLSICDGDSIYLEGAFRSTAGIYYDTLSTVAGCDSVIATNLNLLPVYLNNKTESICQGDSLFLGGAFQTAAGIYYDTLTTMQGCDSVISSTLVLLPVFSDTVDVEICEGDSYFAGGANQNSTGLYSDVLTSSDGCDSTVVTNLTVHPTVVSLLNLDICDGDSLFLAGAWQTVSGSYYDTLTAATGCDSIVKNELIVHPVSIQNQNIDICNGDSFFVAGAFQHSTGTYYDTLSTGLGCDSIIVTSLTVNPNYLNSRQVDICDGDIYYVGGAWQSVSGIYTDNFTTSKGCDSTVVTNLTVHPVIVNFQNLDICSNDSIWLEGAWQNTTGTYYDTLTTLQGCDSIISTNLLVQPTYLTNRSVSICSGESYYAAGAWQTVTGTYYDTLSSQMGCDSVLVTQLDVALSYIVLVDTSICAGESYYAAGTWQTATGVYVDSLLTTTGCDSFIVTVLTVLPTYNITFDIDICAGESYYVAGAWQTLAGTYHDSLSSSAGCDSIIITNLTINPTFSENLNQSICEGDSIYLAGAFQTTTGTYYDTLSTVTGCDSIVITDLIVNPTYSTTIDVEICDGENYYAAGSFQTATGTYYDSLSTVDGCDSIITTNLIVNPTHSTSIDVEICDGESYYVAGALQTTTGLYIDSLTNTMGCDSVVSTNLTVRPSYQIEVNLEGCLGDSFWIAGAWQHTSGVYHDSLQTVDGCDSIITTTLYIGLSSLVFGEATICHGDSLFVGGAWQHTSGVYQDSIASGGNCPTGLLTFSLTVVPELLTLDYIDICEGESYYAAGANQSLSGIYRDILTSETGCDSIVETHLSVHATPVVDLADFSEDSVCVDESELQIPLASPLGGTYSGILANQNAFLPKIAGLGEHLVYYHFTDDWGCKGSDSTKIRVVDCPNESNFEFERVPDIHAYPNPNNGIFSLEIASIHSDFYRIVIVDVQGRVLYKTEVENVDGLTFDQREIDLSAFSEGIYFIQLFADFGVITEKIKIIKE